MKISSLYLCFFFLYWSATAASDSSSGTVTINGNSSSSNFSSGGTVTTNGDTFTIPNSGGTISTSGGAVTINGDTFTIPNSGGTISTSGGAVTINGDTFTIPNSGGAVTINGINGNSQNKCIGSNIRFSQRCLPGTIRQKKVIKHSDNGYTSVNYNKGEAESRSTKYNSVEKFKLGVEKILKELVGRDNFSCLDSNDSSDVYICIIPHFPNLIVENKEYWEYLTMNFQFIHHDSAILTKELLDSLPLITRTKILEETKNARYSVNFFLEARYAPKTDKKPNLSSSEFRDTIIDFPVKSNIFYGKLKNKFSEL